MDVESYKKVIVQGIEELNDIRLLKMIYEILYRLKG